MVSRRTDRTLNPFLITGDVVALMANCDGFRENFLRTSLSMNTYTNLPLTQRRTQELADRFNVAEELWRGLEVKRRRRRERYPEISPEFHAQLDLLDFANARPLQDCIGFVVQPE